MASTQNCTYKSVKLVAGEQFILPPGAEIVSTTNGLEDYTSTCPKPSTLDVTKRFRVQWEIKTDDNNNRTDPWENATITGVSIGGTYTATSINGISGQTDLQNFLQNTVQAVFTNYDQNTINVSEVNYYQLDFDSPSIIAESTIFYIKVQGRTGGDTGTYMEIVPYLI
jgi:hypothetical protein